MIIYMLLYKANLLAFPSLFWGNFACNFPSSSKEIPETLRIFSEAIYLTPIDALRPKATLSVKITRFRVVKNQQSKRFLCALKLDQTGS